MPAKLSYEQVKKVFEEERGFVLLDTDYVNKDFPMNYVCTCGTQSKMSYNNARKGKSCSECRREKVSKAKLKYTAETVADIFKENGCEVTDVYNGDWNKPIDYLCVCGNESKILLRHFLNGHRCQKCRSKKVGDTKRKYTIDDIKIMFETQGKELLETNPFRNSITPMKYKCSCGEISSITLSNFLKGKDCFHCGNIKISESKKNSNITNEDRIAKRQTLEYRHWRKAVYERDNYTCQRCGDNGTEINAHHISNYLTNKEGRTDVNNGVTLCRPCHSKFHIIYGKFNNDEFQLKEYLQSFEGAD